MITAKCRKTLKLNKDLYEREQASTEDLSCMQLKTRRSMAGDI